MSAHPNSIGATLSVLVKEGRRRIRSLTAIFAVVAVIALPIGLSIPKRWDSSTLIVVEASSILRPIMEGRAVATDAADQSGLLKQVMSSRRILRELLRFGGWQLDHSNALQQEQLVAKFGARIRIETPRPELVRISYYDTDPERSARITNKIAEVYIREASAARERASREAFDLVDKRVSEYAEKLTDAHQKLLDYYHAKLEAAPPLASTPSGAPRQTARRSVGTTPAPPSAVSSPESRRTEEQLSARIVQLQSELDRLLAAYTEQHPAVEQTRSQLNAAVQARRDAEEARLAREQQAAEAAAAAANELIAAARGDNEIVRRPVTTPPSARPLGQPGAPGTENELRGVGGDAALSELLRRYEATRDTYQDLLRRRDIARVSMDLESEHRGYKWQVQEAAETPIMASGMRLAHLSLIGLIVAAAVPIGVLFAIVRFDGRVRTESQIEHLAHVAVLMAIPPSESPLDRRRRRTDLILGFLMVFGALATYVAVFLYRIKTS